MSEPRNAAKADAATPKSAAIDMTKLYELAVVEWEGNPVKCIYLNDYRIVGGKPWGGASRMRTFQVSLKDLAEAIPDLRAAIAKATGDA